MLRSLLVVGLYLIAMAALAVLLRGLVLLGRVLGRLLAAEWRWRRRLRELRREELHVGVDRHSW